MSRPTLKTVPLLAALALALAIPSVAGATEHAIEEGSLTWGVKKSWREYIGSGSQVGGGATITGWAEKPSGSLYAEGFEFPVASGTFDDGTNTTRLELSGYVHFQAYCTEGDPENGCLLDTRYSNLSLQIGPDAQILRGTHTGYSRTDPGGELHEDVDVVLAKYDVEGATADFSGDQSRWTGIPTVAGPGLALYGESAVLDPTSVEYVGPGGAPDLAEQWDTPGAPGLEAQAERLADPGSSARVLHASSSHELVHVVDLIAAGTAAAELRISAYEAESLEPVGTQHSWDYAASQDHHALRTAFDPVTDSVFFVSFSEGSSLNEASVHRAVWNAGAEEYGVEDLGSLGDLGQYQSVFGLAWNPVEEELAVIADRPDEDVYVTDTLHRFHRDGGIWQHDEAPLRLPDSGKWAGASAVTSPFRILVAGSVDGEPLGVARDGSYVAAGRTGSATVGGEKRHYPSLHIGVAGDGSPAVEPIAGTETALSTFGSYHGFHSVAEDVDGSLLVHDNTGNTLDAAVRVDVAGGEAVKLGEAVDAPADAYPPLEVAGFANSMAADPDRNLVWASDAFNPQGHSLHALRDDEIVGSYVNAGFPESGNAGSGGAYSRIETGPDGAVYLPIVDPESDRNGYRRLAFSGFVPEVTSQPESRSVSLGVDEESDQVQFSVAIADEADSIQWQSSAPGQAAFADIESETETTLPIDATPELDGTEYRAKVSNAAGAIISDVAVLEVEHAPAIASDLSGQTVTEGEDALFLVGADGNPDPEVTWQRRVAGYWQEIVPPDDNFVVNGPSLTVPDTNVDQSGSLFRAKLVNSAGTTFSEPAMLAVEPSVEIPDAGVELESVSLEWSGNEEMQKAPPAGGSNYFSAGASGGDEDTYSAAADNTRVYQVAPGGAETLATWATRAGHVGGPDEQLVHLLGGAGRVEPDGSVEVSWEGSFSVNFYGGLVPFTFVDPKLEIDGGGAGTLTATMVGCESSQAEPGVCAPFAAESGVTVATFSGVGVSPAGEVEIDPDYAGVEIEAPAGEAAQNRTAAGWGAWPQGFVDFHAQTGLASYWYTSGSAFDPYKAPHPFTVDFAGEAFSGGGSGSGNGERDGGEGEGEPLTLPVAPAAVPAPVARKPLLRRAGRWAGVRRNGIAVALRVGCRGPLGCVLRAPRSTWLKIGKRRYRARVLAPAAIEAGGRAQVRLRLSMPARRALRRGKRARGRLWVGVRSGNRRAARRVGVLLRPGGRGGAMTVTSRTVGSAGLVAIGAVRCRARRSCRLRTPDGVSTRLAGKRFGARVIAPGRVAPGKTARIRLRLGTGALERLGDDVAVLRARVALRAGKRSAVRTIVVRLKRRAGSGGAGGHDGGADDPGEEGPRSTPLSPEPAALTRPASAVDVEDVEVAWHPRDSWVRYASSGVGTGDGIHIGGGAAGIDSTSSPCPDRPSSSDAELPYTIEFAPGESWYDPESGTASVRGQGSVRFRWKAHTIDLTAADPEIEIAGAASRAVFRVSGSEGTAYPERRADLVSLDLSGQPVVSNGGKTFAYSLVRGTLTANGVNVFAGFYTPPDNDEFGCVSVEFTVP